MRGTDPRILEASPGRGLTPAMLLRRFVPGAVGLLFGSRALASWAGQLPDGWEGLRDAVIGWDQLMQTAGLTTAYDVLQHWTRAAVEATF